MHEKPVDLVSHGVATNRRTHLLDHARVVTSERHGELVLDHPLEHTGRDRRVSPVDGGRVDAHEQIACADARYLEVVTKTRCTFKAVEGKSTHIVLLDRLRQDRGYVRA